MTYKIEFSNQATKFIRKLQKDIKERVKSKFRDVSQDPFRYLEHYEGDSYYKLRIGGFRALIDIDSARNILFARVFDKRGRIY